MRKTKLIIGFIIGLLLTAVAVIALFFVNPAVFRNQLEAGATAVFGRQVQFDGPINLERSLRPWIVIEDIAIGNPGWVSGAHLATVEKIGFRVALLPLLRGDLRVLDVSLTGVGVFIEKGPDGADNYTFGDKSDRKEPGVLPAIEQLTIRDAIINYRSADANTMRFEIAEARLWNIPGKPERIEGKGSTKGMAFTIEFAADTASELSGPQNPWFVKLNIQGSDLSLIMDGRMTQPFVWDHGDYHITINGKQADSLENLLGVEFPATGPFELSSNVNVAGGLFKLTDLMVQMGENRITGGVRWEDKTPRPLLTGKLSSDSLELAELLNTTPKLLSKTGKAEVFDRPIRLDWLKDIDAKLELNVKSVADSPISVENIRSAVTLSNGKLSAPFRGNLAGASVDGQIHLTQPNNLIGISLKATLGRIDVGQALKQLKLSDKIAGTADAVVLEGSSQGETLDALLKQATITLRIKPANLSLTGQAVARAIDFKFDSAEFFTKKDRPVTAVFTGILQKDPFKATVSATNLVEMLRMDVPLQLRVALQREDVQLNAEVTILRPFKNMEFDLKHELTGKEIEGLSPLFNFAVPLQGEFQATGLLKARGNKFTYEEDLQVGQSDLKLFLTVLRKPTHPKITGRILARELHIDNMRFFDVDKSNGNGVTENGSRVIPDYTIPIDALLAADLDLDIKAERIRTQLGDLGDFVSKVRLKDGWFKSSTNISGFMGARISSEFDLNAAVKPPLIKIQLNAKDLNFGLLLSKMDMTDLIEGKIDLLVDLSGSGATRYSFLGNAAGRITIIGGPGQITGRRIDLWAADLFPTMLSSRWQREDVAKMNCMVAHIELKEGFAEIEDLILDTQRITIASSGILNLETEALDLVIVPKPKRASLISLAKPVKITGTLSEPKVSTAKIPRQGQLATTGALAALINPAFLILAFSDIGTGEANPCESAVERAYIAYEADLQ